MNDWFYNIHGVTPNHMYPEVTSRCDVVTICETDLLTIPCAKPDLEEVLDIFVTIHKKDIKLIKKRSGCKWVIHAIKNIKIMYEANTPCQSVHTAHFSIPFCIVVEAETDCADFFIAVEDIHLTEHSCRSFYVSVVICAIEFPGKFHIEKHEEHFHSRRKKYEDYGHHYEEYRHRKHDDECECDSHDDHHENHKRHKHERECGCDDHEKHKHERECGCDHNEEHKNELEFKFDYDDHEECDQYSGGKDKFIRYSARDKKSKPCKSLFEIDDHSRHYKQNYSSWVENEIRDAKRRRRKRYSRLG
ncbi:DUF3794 domain-containing protein [Pseudalkalibacillus hwajinpoensis]|uniref:DUF3794 domain-containing protein n=1 Tax=Guptibacillus hwajinpoensis TaxID=208199 RepID=A0A4U1MMI6_9BACL|nr:DUF3794 domain-containing protein [Pseudalkalibacillus hwajinpoensis]TKD72167.1 DUF3794 domain-containing protein [Pseudalkalibacillus hwajinpoensis]